jgi:hypothetical protein
LHVARARSVCRAPHSRPAVVTNVVKLTEKVTLITGAGNNVVAQAGDGGSFLVDCGDAAHGCTAVDYAVGARAADRATRWRAPRKDTADLLMSKGGVAGTPAQTKK